MLRQLYASGERKLPAGVPTAFLAPAWRKLIGTGPVIDRRTWEVAVVMTLRDQLRAGDIWVEGSRAFRAFDDFLLPPAAFAAKRKADELGLAVPDRFETWRDERLGTLERRLREVAKLASAGKLPQALITEAGLSINPSDRTIPMSKISLAASTACCRVFGSPNCSPRSTAGPVLPSASSTFAPASRQKIRSH